MRQLLQVVGLKNPIGGNVCFINAVIQGLLGVPHLAAEAKYHTHKKSLEKNQINQVK